MKYTILLPKIKGRPIHEAIGLFSSLDDADYMRSFHLGDKSKCPIIQILTITEFEKKYYKKKGIE